MVLYQYSVWYCTNILCGILKIFCVVLLRYSGLYYKYILGCIINQFVLYCGSSLYCMYIHQYGIGIVKIFCIILYIYNI